MRLRDRLDPSSFAEDEVVGIAAAKNALAMAEVPKGSWMFLSERLYERLLSLGRAYSLHFAAVLDSYMEVKLNSMQCQAFLEEVKFLGEVVSDPALFEVFAKLVPTLEEVARRPNMVLWFSPP